MRKKKDTQTNISAKHREVFDALRDPRFVNFALVSCYVNGEPAAAIAAINPNPNEPEMSLISPLFVSVTEAMTLSDHEGVQA
jgi:hypothetical protein